MWSTFGEVSFTLFPFVMLLVANKALTDRYNVTMLIYVTAALKKKPG